MDNAPVCTHCADRWYLMERNCIKCPENCSLCVSSEECLECKNNFYYGKTCNLTCNTACINKTCDITGSCKHGCDNSKYGKECDKECMKHCKTCLNSTMCLECEAGYFGKSCTMCLENCNKCENRSTCTHCKIGWTYDNGKCLEKNKKHPDATCINGDESNDSNCNDQQQLTPLIASIVPILLMIIVFYLVVWQMKQKWKNRSIVIEQHTLEPLQKRTGHCYENAGVSVYNTRGSQALLEEIDPDEQSNDTDVDEFESHNYVNVNMTRISLQRLWEYKLQNAANDLMNTEFKTLPTGLLLNCKEAKKSENKKRNRYKYVYPYDANRVMLSTDGKECNDSYINASYINGFETPKEYIASQGPFTDETVTDFWRMVWNENVNTIVILTNLEENGVKKCKKYWPSTETMYGFINVKTLSSDSSSCYKVRRFQITMENESRKVEQFHFTAWPDKGVPSTVNSILDFRRKMRGKVDITNPIVVHCSAGIGRTGTFIALDFLINQGQKERSVDVVSCVTNLRYQRTHLVQTVEQYNYLYGAVTKELTGKESGKQENEFITYYNQMKRINQSTGTTFIEEEFNLIEKLAPGIDENRYQTAKAVNNRHKNRHSNILTDDNFRIYINRPDGDYINAISLPSVQQNFAYIITHTPLPETVDDFFSMMADQEVLTIVQLDNDADEVFGTRCRSKDETFSQNSYELNPQEKTTFGNFELLTCHFQDDHALVSRHVKLYRGRFWNGNHVVPNDLQPMISLVETILNRRREQMENPVVVVCRDGAQRSGLFCVLANLVEQLQLSGSVDILQTVLNVRHRRPQIVPCLEQLEYIYDFIKKYLESGTKV
nr:receptor-type tyrosine-protein phosphatase alpha [Crassostrea gigas]